MKHNDGSSEAHCVCLHPTMLRGRFENPKTVAVTKYVKQTSQQNAFPTAQNSVLVKFALGSVRCSFIDSK